MAAVPKVFTEATYLPAAAAATPGLYVCPSNLKGIIKKATVCNTDTAARLVTFRVVTSGGTETSALYDLWQTKSLYPGQQLDIFEAENHVMEAGDFITAFSDSANKVSIRISGIELTV